MTRLAETTKGFRMYFALLLPKSHEYILVACNSVKGLMNMYTDMGNVYNKDLRGSFTINITRADFLNGIDVERQNCVADSTGADGAIAVFAKPEPANA